MSESYVGFLRKNFEQLPDLCYSDILGIENSPRFSCRNFVEENHVLVFVNRGNFICQQGEFSRVLGEGEYLLLDKRIRHTYFFDPAIPSEIYWMHLNGSFTHVLIRQIEGYGSLPFVGQDPTVFSVLKRCISAYRDHSATPFSHSAEISTVLHVILEEAFRQARVMQFPREEIEFKNRVEQVIAGVDLKDVTLDVFCEKMNLSKYYFSHRFKQYYGVSPIRYLNRIKLFRAKRLLLRPEAKISSVAADCGFFSPSHFSTAFRKEFGISPVQYRKERIGNVDRKGVTI